MADPVISVVKRNLRLARNRLRISQREAAKRAGISKSVLEKYESNENDRIPNTRQLFRLAEAYDLSLDYLLGRSDVGDVQRRLEPSASPSARKHGGMSIVGV
jgi:transcriptional regulator with XRE-family HTH domain